MPTTSIRFTLAAIAATITLTGLAPSAVSAGTFATDQHEFIHARMGENTREARSVGLITAGFSESNGVVRGSGVLVGGRFVLTSAHLLDDSDGGVFTLNGQTYNMQRWVTAARFYSLDSDTANPTQRIFGGAGADLALVELDRRVLGARQLKATISKSRKEAGKTATIVGYGTAGNGSTGISTAPISTDGLMNNGDTTIGVDTWGYQPKLRAGKNVVEPISPFSGDVTSNNRELTIDFDPAPDQLSVLADAGLNPPQFDPFTGTFDVDEDDIPITSEYMPAAGDSGGGLFINGKLAGITSWTTRANSEYFSQASFSRLSVGWWRWVETNIRAFNHVRDNGLTDHPWNLVNNGGNGFRGVTKIRDEQDVDEDGNEIEVLNIFGPGLFHLPDGSHLDVDTNLGFFIANDFAADPAPLAYRTYVPEPASLALLSLGGLAMLRRTRA